MANLRIIYAPETDNFRLGDVDMYGDRYVGDSLLGKLRKNYGALKEAFKELPSKVGVVTYPFLLKNESHKMFGKIENPSTHYMPLAILKKILDFEESLDLDNPLAVEHFYRATNLLISNPACLDLRARKEVCGSMTIPAAEKAKAKLRDASKRYLDAGNQEISKGLNEVLKIFNEIYPTFEDLERVYKEVQKNFDRNKVSANFPLYFLPTDFFLPSLFSVSLEEKIERGHIIDTILECLKAGCEATDQREIPEDVRKSLEVLQKDRFGQTKSFENLDDLLNSLPLPKTIITDTYIVDNFPKLVEIGFEAYEFSFAA